MSLEFWSEKRASSFEQLYLALRKKEGRILSDDQIKTLPYLKNHPLEKEWKLRQKSTRSFLKIAEKSKLKYWWEIGCGNGWFAHQLSLLQGSKVIGTDVNVVELQQADRNFKKSNLHFAYCESPADVPQEIKVEAIVFNACIQYFEEPQRFIEACKKRFPGVKVFILDSPIYSNNQEALEAAERSEVYYTKMGFPNLSKFYFHHSWKDIKNLSVIYKPSKYQLYGRKNPFPILQID
jgi:SAM-dependent methyltransferase